MGRALKSSALHHTTVPTAESSKIKCNKFQSDPFNIYFESLAFSYEFAADLERGTSVSLRR